MKENKTIASGLYTTEAKKSKRTAKAELEVPDPPEEEARKVLAGEQERDEDAE